jgi:hypothetical protein
MAVVVALDRVVAVVALDRVVVVAVVALDRVVVVAVVALDRVVVALDLVTVLVLYLRNSAPRVRYGDQTDSSLRFPCQPTGNHPDLQPTP